METHSSGDKAGDSLKSKPPGSSSSESRYSDDKPNPIPCSSKTAQNVSNKTQRSGASANKERPDIEKLLDELSNKRNDKSSEDGPNTSDNDPNTNDNSKKPPPFFKSYKFSFQPAPKKKYANSEEYFADLRLWLHQAFFWQSAAAAFPYFMMCQQMSSQNSQSGGNVQPPYPFPFPMPGFQAPPPRQDQTPPRADVFEGVECRIPPFWKRIAAEFIDFMLLCFVKIAVTYVAVDIFNFVEMDSFDLFQKDVKTAYKTFIQITQDIVILEIVHRLVVCAFETFWLIGSQNGRVGGATPGKSIIGLRVITCDTSVPLREGDDRVVIKPGGNLSIGTSFLRALTKNFVIALLIPTSFAFIFFPHNRTGYDMICNTIVVEEPIFPHRVHQD